MSRRLRSTNRRLDAMQLPPTPAPAPPTDYMDSYDPCYNRRNSEDQMRRQNDGDFHGYFEPPPTPQLVYNQPLTPAPQLYNQPLTPAPQLYGQPLTPAPQPYNQPLTPAPQLYNQPLTPAPPINMCPPTPYFYHQPPETPGGPSNIPSFMPPPTPGGNPTNSDFVPHTSLSDTVEDFEDVGMIPYQDQNDPGPASVASSLDTPHNSPPHTSEVTSSYGYTGRGPRLSESSSSESEEEVQPPPVVKSQSDSKPSAPKRRRVSSSPEDRSKKVHLSSSPVKPSSDCRMSRPRRRETSSYRLSSYSSSPDMQGPPPTPRPVIKSDKSETSGKRYRMEELLKESSPVAEKRTTRRKRVPKTPSPSTSVERPFTPDPQSNRQLTPSPSFGPPPTPAMPRVASPLTTSGGKQRVKAEPRTPRWQDGTPGPSNKLAVYDPHEAVKQIQGQKNLGVGMWDKSAGTMLSTPGTIKRVKMYNIMSHSKFEGVFSPTFNFIQGENGSGKSAILSAIVAGLGGKALDTGRANSMKDIIKIGQSSARIEITLNNFPSKLYGDEIRIVRCLSVEGSSRYQISDGNRGLRSLGRAELNMVLSKLNIQVDNPLAILHQEMSRNFLRQKNPNTLYDYFYRALLLGSCEQLLKKASEDLESAIKLLKTKKHLLEDLRTKERELKSEIELIEQLKNAQQTLKELEDEYVWAMVKEHDDIFQKVRKELDFASHRYEDAKNERDKIDGQKKEFEGSQSSFQERWQEIQTQYEDLDKEYDRKRKEAHNLNVRIKQVEVSIHYADQNLAQHHEHIYQLESKVREHEANMAHQYAEKIRQMEIQKERLEGEKNQLNQQLEQLNSVQAYQLNEVEVHSRAEQDQEAIVRDSMDRMNNIKKELAESEKAKNSKYNAYGREMAKIVERINSEKRWIKKPRGPLGSCITVNDPKWVQLVEFILGSHLCSFAVDNKEDKQLLDLIIDNVFKQANNRNNSSKPSICLMNFGEKKIDIRSGQPKCGYPTILNVLEITGSDYVVFNWLVDAANVERILLFENYVEACNFMKAGSHQTRNVLRGYSLDEYLFYPDPNFKALAQRSFKSARFLKVKEDTSVTVTNAQALRSDFDYAEREFEAANGMLCKLKQNTKVAKDKVNQTAYKIKNISQRIGKLDWDLRNGDFTPNTPDVATWQEEIENLKARMRDKQEEKNQSTIELQELHNKRNSIQLKQLEDQKEALKKQQRRMHHQKETAEGQINQFDRELKAKEAVVNDANRKKVEAMKKYNEAEKLLKEKTEIAIKNCPTKITIFQGTSVDIKNRHDFLKAELKKNMKKLRMYSDMQRQYKVAKANADNVAMEIKVMDTLIMLALPKIKIQKQMFDIKMKDYGSAVTNCFSQLIAARGYKGGLAISHEDKTLSCYVSLDKCSENRAKRNLETKNGITKVVSRKGIMEFAAGMSGGERSFTTICFLVSCWQLMDMPFYIVDEFDVFMDPMNRGISQSIVVEATKNKPNCQFFIFSPQPLEMDIHYPKDSLTFTLSKKGNAQLCQVEEDNRPERNGRRAIK